MAFFFAVELLGDGVDGLPGRGFGEVGRTWWLWWRSWSRRVLDTMVSSTPVVRARVATRWRRSWRVVRATLHSRQSWWVVEDVIGVERESVRAVDDEAAAD
ncbi:hypothetical protein [Kitasatospora sp. NPDC050463]|uniref:hypothetical protein n=1 Tax=Kitasatospora sp. NPDC050463 TaxID=3155786 RepID=UPI0033E80C64